MKEVAVQELEQSREAREKVESCRMKTEKPMKTKKILKAEKKRTVISY